MTLIWYAATWHNESLELRAGRDLPPKNTQRWTLRAFFPDVESGLYLVATTGRCRTSAGLSLTSAQTGLTKYFAG
jgi:hypothetical protein